MHRATFELDGKSVSGSGRKKRQAETAAARKYLDGNFLTGEVSSQSGKSVKSTKKQNLPPSKLKKQIERSIKFKKRLAELNKREEIVENESPVLGSEQVGEAEVSYASDDPVVSAIARFISNDNVSTIARFVSYDIERAAGPDDSEMIELGFATTESSASVCIIPKGIIDSYASKMSHQLSYNYNMKKLVRGRYIMDDVTLEEAAKKFIDFLRETKEKTGMSPILLCHGKDHITLLNNLAAVGMDDALLEGIGGAMMLDC